MKKALVILLCAAMLATAVACDVDNGNDSANTSAQTTVAETTGTQASAQTTTQSESSLYSSSEESNLSEKEPNIPKELETILNPNFSSSPFLCVVEGSDPLTDDEIKSTILSVPDNQYETYPNLHNMPITATLYKDDEVVPINLNDTRLIRLINFYNNSVYYHQYSYTQGLLSIEYLETKVLNEDFRLVLTFTTKNNSASISYDTNIQAYDTIVITNQWFVLINHDLQGYEGQEDKYPFQAVGHIPLFNNYCWLDLLGF